MHCYIRALWAITAFYLSSLPDAWTVYKKGSVIYDMCLTRKCCWTTWHSLTTFARIISRKKYNSTFSFLASQKMVLVSLARLQHNQRTFAACGNAAVPAKIAHHGCVQPFTALFWSVEVQAQRHFSRIIRLSPMTTVTWITASTSSTFFYLDRFESAFCRKQCKTRLYLSHGWHWKINIIILLVYQYRMVGKFKVVWWAQWQELRSSTTKTNISNAISKQINATLQRISFSRINAK